MALWLDSGWKKRIPLMADMSTATWPADPDRKIVIDLSLFKFWGAFWEHVGVAGADIVVTAADGSTPLYWALTGFNKTNKTGLLTIELSLDAIITTLDQAAMWIYWESVSTKTPAATVTATTPAAFALLLDGPGYAQIEGNPTITKPAGESQAYAFTAPTLAELCAPSEGSTGYEAVRDLTLEVLDGTGTPVPAMVGGSLIGLMQCARSGTTAIKAPITGGTLGTEYTIRVTIRTTLGRVLLLTATLSVT